MPGKWIAVIISALLLMAVSAWISREIIIDVYDAIYKSMRRRKRADRAR